MEFAVGKDFCDSTDLWYNEEESELLLVNGKEPSFVRECLCPEEIFNFDVSVFKQFECQTDSSD